MGTTTKELEKQIAEKNNMLESLAKSGKTEREKIRYIKAELDRLLYTYYKSLKGKYTLVGLL